MRIDDGVLRPFLPEGARVTRRQDARRAYSRDGTVYAFRRDTVERFGRHLRRSMSAACSSTPRSRFRSIPRPTGTGPKGSSPRGRRVKALRPACRTAKHQRAGRAGAGGAARARPRRDRRGVQHHRRRPLARRGGVRAAVLGAVPALVRRAGFTWRPNGCWSSRAAAPPSWYRPFAANYRETFDYLTPEEFRRRHDERVAANGEQKQTQVLAFERELLRQLTEDVHDRSMLHPSSMYGLFNPFWWGHVGESWVHAHADYARLAADCDVAFTPPASPYTAVKFYFNECFPATDAEPRLRAPDDSTARGARPGRVARHRPAARRSRRRRPARRWASRRCPATCIPATTSRCRRRRWPARAAFVGTYGGFSYLAPFAGVPATAYYSNPGGFSQRHLTMARSALASIDPGALLDVHDTADHLHSSTRQ